MQFRCSLLSRRFGALRTLKHEQVVDLIRTQRAHTGTRGTLPHRTWPKSKTPTVSQLVVADNATPGQWQSYLHGHKGRLETREVLTHPHRHARSSEPGECAEVQHFAQRENPVWQWVGHVCPGRKRWLCSGAPSARKDGERRPLEVHTHLSALIITPTIACLLCLFVPYHQHVLKSAQQMQN